MKLSKSTEFSLKLFVLIVLIAFLVFDFFLQMYAPKANLTGIPCYQRININYAFFTTQSNYLVVIYLFYALFLKQSYNKKPPFGIELAITVYISVTMFVFWTGLLASSDEMNTYNAINWMSTVVLHLVIPWIMITQFILSAGDYYHCVRQHARFGAQGIAAYPFFYLIFALIRGEMRYQEFGPSFFEKVYCFDLTTGRFVERWNEITGGGTGIFHGERLQPYSSQMWYPYWFLNLHKYKLQAQDSEGNYHVWAESTMSTGLMILFLVVAIIVITSCVFGLQYLYIAVNNNKYYRWHDINDKLLSKEEHDYRLSIRRLNFKRMWEEKRLRSIKNKLDEVEFKKMIKTLSPEEREEIITKRKNSAKLQKKLKLAEKRNIANKKAQRKRDIKSLLQNVKTGDRQFIRENIREADRYKKLVKKGVLITKVNYD